MVFRSAECWTDHSLVCATLRLAPVFRKRPSCEQRRFNVGPLRNEEFAKRFARHVSQLLGDVWGEQADGQTQWSAIRDSMLQTCNEKLRRGKKQPDWFVAAESSFRPLISKRNEFFSRCLLSGSDVIRQKYLSQRSCIAGVVRSSKNKWLEENAQSIQDALNQGTPSVIWQDIRAIHECRAGLQPVRCFVIKKRDGVLCVGPEETLNRWRDHFEGVLNVISSYELAALNEV